MRPAKPALREQTGDNRKGLLNLSLAKPRQNAAAIILVYGLFIYRDIKYESNQIIIY
jgi:hypothetical protein